MNVIDVEIEKNVFNKSYLEYLHIDTYTQIFFGGSSSGKSYFLAQRCVLDVLEGRNYLIVRNVANTIKKSTFNQIVKAIYQFNLREYFDINKSEMVITFTLTNKQVLFCGLDDPEKIKSITPIDGVISDIWIEEATETDYDAIKQLYKRLRGLCRFKKRLTMSFNPILQTHWIYREYFKHWDDSKVLYTDDRLFILKTTYKDNEFLTDDDIKALESETDPYFYQVYSLGNWGVLGSVIYKNWNVQDLSEIKDSFDNIKIGLDFGYADDPSALVVTHYDKKRKRIYVFDELYSSNLDNEELATILKQKIDKKVVVCDSAEPKSIAELKKYGIYAIGAKKGKDSVNYGIKFLQKHEIIIHTSCQNFKNEMSQYKWKEDKNGNALPVPVDKFNHCLTADTVINTPDGNFRIIDLVGKTGRVYCFNENDKKPTVSRYFDVRKTRSNIDVFEIELEDGRIIRATEYHPILTKKGWKAVKNLNIDDEIIDISNHICNNYAKIKSIKFIGKQDVYNMEVETYHNFSVNGGLIVHNCLDAIRYAYEDEMKESQGIYFT